MFRVIILLLSLSFSIAAQDLGRAKDLNETGLRFYESGDFASAIEAFTRSIEFSSKPSASRNENFAASDAESNLLERIRIVEPLTAITLTNRGNVYFAVGNMRSAIADYSDAVRIYPAYGEAYLRRSVAYARSGDLESAIVDADRAVKIQPNETSAYLMRAVVRAERKEWEKAFADVDRAVTLSPKSSEVYFRRGDLYRVSGEGAKAESDYQRAINLEDASPGPHIGLGMIAYDRADYERAARHFSDAIRKDDRLMVAHQMRGYANLFLRRERDAERDLRNAVRLQPIASESIMKVAKRIRETRENAAQLR